MSNVMGADPAQLRRLAQEFIAEAASIDEATSSVSSELSVAWWEGPDASRFDQMWHGHYRQNLAAVSEMLRNIANDLRQEADRQDSVSR